jgi:hypothetical protein
VAVDALSPAARTWAAVDRRQRWKAMVVLGILAGITAGFAVAALAGSRRSSTALERFRGTTRGADAVVFSSQIGVTHPDWSKLAAVPEVEDVAVWNLMFGQLDVPGDDLLFVAGDGFGSRLSVPHIVEGRAWDPAAPDEVVVSRDLAKHVPLGAELSMKTFAAAQPDDATDPQGPLVHFKVVGVADTLNEFLFTGQAFVGPGFATAHRDVQLFENADVKLRGGSGDIPALQRAVSDTIGEGTPLLDLHSAARRVETTIDVERVALLMLAVAIAVAGGVLVAQALSRSAASIADDALPLRAMGLTRAELSAGAALAHAPVYITAAVVAVATAVAASPLFPVGLSAHVDPDVGVHADLLALVPGTIALTLALVGVTAFVARRAVRTTRGKPSAGSVFATSARGRVPITVGLGATMALQRTWGTARMSVRPALVGAVVGVFGVIGALTLQHGVDDAIAHPERAGVAWDAGVVPGYDSYGTDGLAPGLLDRVAASVPPKTAWATSARLPTPINGLGVPMFTLENHSSDAAPIAFTLTDGRAPTSNDEAAVGPKTADDLHVGIGDSITFGAVGARARVVGLALFPPDVHAEFDEGVWVTPKTFDAIAPDITMDELFNGPDRAVFVRFPRGTVGAEIAALRDAVGSPTTAVGPADVPVELTNLRNVRTLPVLLAIFLGLLAAGAVTHVLFSSSGRRRRDFAVLRSLGVNRRGTRAVLNAQGSTIGLVGLVLGIPLGLAAGRAAWRWISRQVPLEFIPPIALIAVVAVIPVTMIIVNVLALWPGHRIARMHPAEVLRAE